MGWVANGIIAFGLWNIAAKRRWAFLCTTFGELLWIAHSYSQAQWDLLVICGVFAVLQFRSWWVWGQ